MPANLKRLYQLDSLTTPKSQLAGAYTVFDVPLGPVTGGYKTVRCTPEQLVEYLNAQGLLTAYNARPSLRKAVEFRTLAEKTASGYAQPDSSTMEELDPASMCLGTQVFVSNDPDKVYEYKVVYDAAGPLYVWVDGNFSQSSRGKIQAKLVPVTSAAGTDGQLATHWVAWGNSLTNGLGQYAFPAQLARLVGFSVLNQGVGGETSTQIRTRFDARPDLWKLPSVLWVGKNNLGDVATVKADLAYMVGKLGHQNFLVLSELTSASESHGTPAYAAIQDFNAYLATTYAGHYVDVRTPLVAAYDPTQAQDVTDHGNDVLPTSLRLPGDPLHLTAAGYGLVAKTIATQSAVLRNAASQQPLTAEASLALLQQPVLRGPTKVLGDNADPAAPNPFEVVSPNGRKFYVSPAGDALGSDGSFYVKAGTGTFDQLVFQAGGSMLAQAYGFAWYWKVQQTDATFYQGLRLQYGFGTLQNGKLEYDNTNFYATTRGSRQLLMLSPNLDLAIAQQQLSLEQVQPRALHALTGNWNAAGANTTVYVLSLTVHAFANTGWVVDGSGVLQSAAVDVAAGTWQATPPLTAQQLARLAPVWVNTAAGDFIGYQSLADALAAGQVVDGVVTLNLAQYYTLADEAALAGNQLSLRGNGLGIYGDRGGARKPALTGTFSDIGLAVLVLDGECYRVDLGTITVPANRTLVATDSIIAYDIEVYGTLIVRGTTEFVSQGGGAPPIPFGLVVNPDGSYVSAQGGKIIDERGGITQADLAAVRTTLPLTATRTAAYTLALPDAGCLVPVSSSSAVTLTVPGSGDVAYPLGALLTVRQTGTGPVTLAAAYGVNLLCNSAAGLKTAGQYLDLFLHKVDRDTWVVTNGVQ